MACDKWPGNDSSSFSVRVHLRANCSAAGVVVKCTAVMPQREVGLPGSSRSCNMQYSFVGVQPGAW